MSNGIKMAEVVCGALLHAIGEFMQRAHASIQERDPGVRAKEAVIFPGYREQSSHHHAQWTDAFFEAVESAGFGFPEGMDSRQIRELAVDHHAPAKPAHWLIAEANRLAAGLDRQPRNQARNQQAPAAFREVALQSVLASVDLGLGSTHLAFHPLGEQQPGEEWLPRTDLDHSTLPSAYHHLWQRFLSAFLKLSGMPTVWGFVDALTALLERFTSTMPSSTTVDLPDVSLYDHARLTAALAAVLFRFHGQQGELDRELAIKDRERLKFRLLVGDLSGIQKSLFQLAHQQVKGVNRILRARSLLMGLRLEGVALIGRERLGLPAVCVIQSAGGKFMMVIPHLDDTDELVKQLAREVDSRMRERHLGTLSLNLVVSSPFAGRDLMEGNRLARVLEGIQTATAETKQRAMLEEMARPITEGNYALGVCPACGLRPAERADPFGEEIIRCLGCHDELQVGGWLPDTVAIGWRQANQAGKRSILLGNGLEVCFLAKGSPLPKGEWLSWYGIVHEGSTGLDGGMATLPARYLANYLPVVEEQEQRAGWFDDLSVEARAVAPGETKTFEHLAALARERVDDGWLGKPFLAVLKADVDRLGMIFTAVARRGGLSRVAALSRQMDLFFTGHLRWLITHRPLFRQTYTVYAGGDDLLLIGPWRQTIELAAAIREQFKLFSGGNPNVTLSAGLELIAMNHPLNRAVEEAEFRLKQAKAQGRNRVALLSPHPVAWKDLNALLGAAERINRDLRQGEVGTGFVHRLWFYHQQRRKVEEEHAVECAGWRAHWGYHLRRNVLDRLAAKGEEGEKQSQSLRKFYNGLLGLEEQLQPKPTPVLPLEIPITIALYRNRS